MTSDFRVLSGRYRVDDLIGRGGMASVYRGFDQTLGRPVAIKILKRELAEDAAFRTRFRLEAQAASRMANPAIVRVFDAGEDEQVDADGSTHPLPYIVMELVQGALLKDLIAGGPIAQAEAIRYADGILEALEYSHRAGVVHRDIKPGNVMVTDRGQVKVMDFGIARAVSESSSTVADTTAILGTAAYFSPEQAKGEAVDARADLYSTGVVLFELLTGRQPFRGESPVAVAYQHVSETPLAPSELNEAVPRALDAVVLRALAKDPFQRFQTSAQFRESLRATTAGAQPSKKQLGALTNELYGANPRHAAETARSLRQLSTDATMTRTQSGPPVAWIWTGVAVLAAVLVALFFWLVTMRPPEPPPSNAREVPELAGMAWDVAEAELDRLDLEAVRIDETSEEQAEGDVIGTVPEAGTSVTVGEEIRVRVSTGAETVAVPTLTGRTEQEARELLSGAGLVLGQIRSVSKPGVAAGVVLSATPADGAEVVVGTAVDLEVSSGFVVVDDFQQKTVAAAREAIEAVQLTVNEIPNPECPATDPPVVASQSVIGQVPVGTVVDLTVCSG